MKKLLLALMSFLPVQVFAGTHVMVGDPVTASSLTVTGGGGASIAYGLTVTSVTASSNVVITSSNTSPSLKVTANGGDYGTNKGSSGGFLASCPGTSQQGMCAQVYSNQGSQNNLAGVFNVIADNTDWNTVTMYVKADGTDPENGIRIDGEDYATLVLNDSMRSGGATNQNGKYQFSSHNDQLRGERRNAANNSFESAWVVANTTITSGGVMMISTGYENPASTLAVNGNLIVGNGYAGDTTGGSAPRNGALIEGAAVFKSSITLDGSGTAAFDLTEGAASSAGPPAASHSILWADSSSHTIVFNPNNTSTYTVVGSSKSPTAGNLPMWSGQGSLIDSGFAAGTGGMVSPGTFTWVNTGHGVSVSTMVVSSNTVLQGATWYANFPPKIGGNLGSTSAMYINGGNGTATGASNVMIGDPSTRNTGDNLTTGNSLSCLGSQACGGVVTANNSVGVGDSALLVSSAGANNTAVGSFALWSSTSGGQNTAVGRTALGTMVSGSNNTAIGYGACNGTGASSTTYAGSICIGRDSSVDSSAVMAFGSPGFPITDVFANSKYQTTNNTNGSSVTFRAQMSSGTDKVGGSLGLAAGQGTGAGAGSTIDLWVSSSTAAGTTVQLSTMVAQVAYPGIAPIRLTAAVLLTIAPKQVGLIVGCSDCTTLPLCVSTGTATGAWSSTASKIVACN